MEIERKFLVKHLPEGLEDYPSCHLRQGYLNVDPVVRVRQEGDEYTLTYKSSGMLAREEYNLPLTQEAFEHMIDKCDGIVIAKRRYRIPFRYKMIELDVFEREFEGLLLAEIEFDSIKEAEEMELPAWFGTEVTYDPQYHNNALSAMTPEEAAALAAKGDPDDGEE